MISVTFAKCVFSVFTVSSPPTVTSTSPNFAAQGATSYDIFITGTNFTDASAVSFGTNVTVNSYTVDSTTQITATITVRNTGTERRTFYAGGSTIAESGVDWDDFTPMPRSVTINPNDNGTAQISWSPGSSTRR